MKIEYKICTFSSRDVKKIEEELNKMGEEGWMLAAFDRDYFYFTRYDVDLHIEDFKNRLLKLSKEMDRL